MRKDYLFALVLTIMGMGVGIALTALPFFLESFHLPQPVIYWISKICVYIGILVTAIGFLIAMLIMFWPSKIDPLLEMVGIGGRGGNAKAMGKNSKAEGGVGGKGGIGGVGGAGGDAEATGDNSYARGGDGGNAGQSDGRGGRRTMSPGERLNHPTNVWPYGYGGAGANMPEYDRRLIVLTEIRAEYFNAFPNDAIFIHAGVDQVPVHWVNKRLEEKGEVWRVEIGNGGYKMPPL